MATKNNDFFDLNRLLRDNIRQLIPYSSARDEFAGNAQVYLDANENAFGSPLPEAYNRYPDPLQHHLKEKISEIKSVRSEEHTSELKSLMRSSYAIVCLKQKIH